MKQTCKRIIQYTIAILVSCLALSEKASAQDLNLIDSFEAIPFTGWIPADPTIAAGPSSLVTMIDSRITIFDKKGTKLFEQSLWGSSGFWGAQGASSSVAEPWVIFDPNSSRFIAVASDFGSAKGVVYIAMSKTSTPLASSDWQKTRIDRSGTHQNPSFPGLPTYPDYVKVGVNGSGVYITSLHFAKDLSVTPIFSHAEIFGLDKSALLATGDKVIIYDEPVITGTPVFAIQPAIVFEPAAAMYLVESVVRLASSEMKVHAINGAARTTSVVPVAAYERVTAVPQLGSQIQLENIDSRPISAVYRNGRLWTTQAVKDLNVGDGELLVRWYSFDVSSFPGSDATLAQSGNVDPGAGVHAWLPHIAVDAGNNMALGFSVGGASQYAAIGYTGRHATDAPGYTMPVRIAHTGAGAYTIGGWGEYSGLSVDPDGRTFWQFHIYPTSAGQWSTFASSFQVDARPKIDVASDGFESGNFSGGTGWVGAWTVSGDASIQTSSSPHTGSRHARLRTGNGDIERIASVGAISTLQLNFWAKVSSFEGTDHADVLVSKDGSNYQPVWSFTPAASDNLYHYYTVDLTSLLPASQLHVVFEAHMSATDDNWYLDDIRLSGEPDASFNFPPVANAGPDQSVTDSDNNGAESITLNGSASSDSDGTIVGYEWRESATLLGTGATLTRAFTVGVHSVTLTVTDDDGAIATDSLTVTVSKKKGR